jgi:hypothetical protein
MNDPLNRLIESQRNTFCGSFLCQLTSIRKYGADRRALASEYDYIFMLKVTLVWH